MKTKHVLVIGGGTAGVAAAVAAARAGAKVSLIEKSAVLGGKASLAEVGTLCGLFQYSKQTTTTWAVKGFAREFAESIQQRCGTTPLSNPLGMHYLPYNVFELQGFCDELIVQHEIQLYLHSVLTGITLEQGSIKEVQVLSFDRLLHFHPDAVIDCSGESTVSNLAGLPTLDETVYQSAAQVLTMENVGDTDEAKLGMILLKELKQGIDLGLLHQDMDRVSIVPGSLKQGRVKLKIGLMHAIGNEENKITAVEMKARASVSELARFLIARVPVFKQASLGSHAPEAGVRTGKRSVGKYILSNEEVLQCRKFEDGIAIGCWPVEKWGMDKRVSMQYFAENDHYEIPAGCLISNTIKGLYFAGRIISAEEDAIASARVIGTCLQTGYAAGMLAAGSENDQKGVVAEIRKKQI